MDVRIRGFIALGVIHVRCNDYLMRGGANLLAVEVVSTSG